MCEKVYTVSAGLPARDPRSRRFPLFFQVSRTPLASGARYICIYV